MAPTKGSDFAALPIAGNYANKALFCLHRQQGLCQQSTGTLLSLHSPSKTPGATAHRSLSTRAPPGPPSHPGGSSSLRTPACLCLEVSVPQLPLQPQERPPTFPTKRLREKGCIRLARRRQPPYHSLHKCSAGCISPCAQLSPQPPQRALLSSTHRN